MRKKASFLLFPLILLSATTFCQKRTSSSEVTTDSASKITTQEASQTEAKVTIVKYSDYQCPACAVYYGYEKQLKEHFGDDLKIIGKHFPLNIHPYAHVAARSAEAARKQGKYAEMNDLIFTGQARWSQENAEAIFIEYARSLDMDMEQFKFDMNSADMNRIVRADIREGREREVNSTPTFFINGDKIAPNPRSYEDFRELVEKYMD